MSTRMQWSKAPNESKFLVGKQDLKLYEWSWDDSNAQLVSTSPESAFAKCFAWDSLNDTVAIGYTSGKVHITRSCLFDGTSPIQNSQIIASFTPKHSRSCNALQFNPVNPKLLLCGLDKVRSDGCLNVYSLERSLGSTNSMSTHDLSKASSKMLSMDSIEEMHSLSDLSNESMEESTSSANTTPVQQPVVKPIDQTNESSLLYSVGMSESANSVDWMYSGTCIVAGMSLRFIRVYDLRVNNTTNITLAQTHSTRAVFNVTCDPFNSFQYASFADDGMVRVWDSRKASDPCLLLNTDFRLNQIEWSTRKPGFLAASGKDSDTIKIWNVVSGQEPEQCCIYNTFQASAPNISCFSWIDNNLNGKTQLVYIEKSNSFNICTLREPLITKWSPDNSLSYFIGADAIETSSYSSDISNVMKQRATSGYSLETAHLSTTGDLAIMWSYFVKSTSQKYTLNATWFHGIASTVDEMKGFSALQSPFQQRKVDEPRLLEKYMHKTRQDVLEMCGWGILQFENDESCVDATISKLEAAGDLQKAAFYSLFLQGNMRKAIQILSDSKNQTLVLTGATLAGFMQLVNNSDSTRSPWSAVCKSLVASTNDIFLKAIYAFISSDGKISSVLKSELPLSAKIAIACKYLEDEPLREFIDRLTTEAIEQGNVQGLILTGLNPSAVNLFEKYVDITGDVQTASIVLSIVVPRSFTDSRVENWVENYRELLDCWELYHIRAKFDIFRRRYLGKQGVQSVPAQICIRCNYCNMTINRGFSAPKELSYAGAAANLMRPRASFN